jgi:signal transduction histidine kinase
MQVSDGGGSMLDDDGAPIQILFVGSTTEPGPGAALLASEPGLPRPVAEDGIVIVDAESGTVLDSVVCDITPYTRPLRQARLRMEELATANRRKDEFLAMLGHELRSPLAAIQNAVRLLSSQTGETPPGQRTQALIERQVRRMTQLVDDLLDYHGSVTEPRTCSANAAGSVTAASAGIGQGSEFTVRLPREAL